MKSHTASLIGSEHKPCGIYYTRFAETVANLGGKSKTFAIACTVIAIWLISGPLFHFSDTWQLIINTATTIITFLMMFLLQNTHNRDTDAIQKKLDALLIEISILNQQK